MKKILLYAVLLSCVTWGCKQPKKISYEGVYKLDKQMLSGGGKDTVYAREQIKIYTDDHYIYAGMTPDSSVMFGLGTYSIDTGTMIDEHNVYSTRALDSTQIFTPTMSKTGNVYTQVTPDIAKANDVSYKMTETYTRLPSAGTSALDGIWYLDKTFRMKGKDTVKQNETQYMAFWQGYFMFIHRYPIDQVNTKFKNGFGYGSFSLKNDSLSEEVEMSSHAMLLHRKLAIKIVFNGKDEYTQVINDSKTNEQTTGIYKRLR